MRLQIRGAKHQSLWNCEHAGTHLYKLMSIPVGPSRLFLRRDSCLSWCVLLIGPLLLSCLSFVFTNSVLALIFVSFFQNPSSSAPGRKPRTYLSNRTSVDTRVPRINPYGTASMLSLNCKHWWLSLSAKAAPSSAAPSYRRA